MSTIKRTDDDNHPIIKEVYEDIKQSRNTTYIGNFWKYLAFDPQLLKNVWSDVKDLMVKQTIIPNKTKEMIYMAVSMTNSCEYCIRSHTIAAKKKGMSDKMLKELIAVVGMANETNRLVESYQVEVDDFLK